MKVKGVVAGVVVLFGMWVHAGSGRADPLTPFSGPSAEVTISDVQSHFEAAENRNNEFYSEWWSFAFTLDDGYWAYVQFLITNMGPGDGKAAVTAEASLPDGTKFSERSEYELGQWSSAKDKFELKFGENTLGGPLDGLTIRVKNASFEAEYRLKNVIPPWKPGNGRAQYGASASRYFQFELIAPVAQVEGTIKPAGEEAHKVKGYLYADHSLASIGMHEQAKRWMRFRAVNPKTSFFLGNIETPDIYGNKPIQYAVLFSEGKKVFETTSFEIKTSNDLADPKKAGYAAPQLVEVKAASPKAHLAIKATKLTEREDYLETSGAATRFVLSKFAKPIMYYFDATFAVEATGADGKVGKYGGKGRYYFTVVNP